MIKKKIVFIASYAESLINFRLQLMQDFVAKGYEVFALAPVNQSVQRKLLGYHIQFVDIPLERNGLNPFADLKLFFALKRILKQKKPDCVFSYTIKPVIYGGLAAWCVRIPKVYSLITGTGYTFLNHNLKTKIVGVLAKVLFRISLQRNSTVFFQNKDNLSLFLAKGLIGANKKTCVVNGSGVDCIAFSPTTYPTEISFLMIARLLYDKGVVEYVAAARRMHQRYPGLKFKLVGWIDTNPNAISKAELQAWIDVGDIEYLGKLEDVRLAIAETSVYVLPSYHEGMPRTVLEAMAMGRPIITTDTPGCRETVMVGCNGFLVPSQEVDALYKAMEYFVLAPEEVPIMGAASRKIALEKYDVNKVNASILKEMGVQ